MRPSRSRRSHTDSTLRRLSARASAPLSATIIASLVAFVAGLHAPTARAQTAVVWTGNGGATLTSWSVAANWQNGLTPNNAATDYALTFNDVGGAASSSTNDLTGVRAASLLFNTAHNFSLFGNLITLLAGGSITGPSGASTASVTIGNDLGLLGATTVDVSGANAAVRLTGALSGAGSLVKSGAGTLTLSGANNGLSGGVTVNGGTLVLSGLNNATSLVGTGGLVVNAGASARATSDNALGGGFTYVPLILNGGTYTPWDAQWLGSLTLTGGTYAAPQVANPAWGLQLAANATVTVNASAVTSTIASPIRLDGSGITFNVADGAAATDLLLSGAISQANGFAKTGVGTLTLTGVNTYTGATTVGGGTLLAASVASLGAQGVNGLALSGGRFGFTAGDNLLARDFALSAAGSGFHAEAGGTLTVSGALSGAGGLTKSGAGAVTLTGANAYTGGTTVSGGTLRVGSGGTTGTLGAGDVSVASGATLAFDRSDAVTFSGAITGAGSVAKSGAGTLTLTGTSASGSGGIALNAGTLKLAGAGTGANALRVNGNITAASGTVLVLSGYTASGTSIATANNVLTVAQLAPALNGGATVRLDGSVSGGSRLDLVTTVPNAGAFAANGSSDAAEYAQDFVGGLGILGADATGGGAGPREVYSSAQLQITGATTLAPTLFANAGRVWVTDGGALTVAGGTTLRLGGVAAPPVGTNGGGGGTGGGGTGGGGVDVCGPCSIYIPEEEQCLPDIDSPACSGGDDPSNPFNRPAHQARQSESGVLYVRGVNVVPYNGSTGSNSQQVATGNPTLTLAPGARLENHSALLVAQATVLLGDGALITGPGLVGVENGTGRFTVGSGDAARIESGVGQAGVYVWGARLGIARTPTSPSTWGGGVGLNYSAFVKDGAGTLTLSGENAYLFETYVVNGTLELTGKQQAWGAYNSANYDPIARVPNGPAVGITVTGSGSTLKLAGAQTGENALHYANPVHLTDGGTIAFGGKTAGAAAADVSNVITGPVTLNGSGGTIDTGAHPVALVGAVSGSGGLTKTGAGTLTLSGAQTYSGATVVSGGTLRIDAPSVATTGVTVAAGATLIGNASFGSAALTVGDGALLGGNGTYGAITLASGGTISPGNSVGQISGASLVVDGGTVFEWDITAATADRITLSGAFGINPSSSGDITFAFEVPDTEGAPGGLFRPITLISFGSTDLTDADLARFKAAPRSTTGGNLRGLTGNFALSPTGLTFMTTSADVVPEPGTLALLSTAGVWALIGRPRRRRRVDDSHLLQTPGTTRVDVGSRNTQQKSDRSS